MLEAATKKDITVFIHYFVFFLHILNQDKSLVLAMTALLFICVLSCSRNGDGALLSVAHIRVLICLNLSGKNEQKMGRRMSLRKMNVLSAVDVYLMRSVFLSHTAHA